MSGLIDFIREAGPLGFASAAKNQQVFDRLYYKLLNLSADDFNVFPRPSKWANRSLLITKILKLTSSIFAFLWCYFFAYIYVAFRLASYLTSKGYGLKRAKGASNTVAFAICDRSCTVLSQIASGSQDVIWITPPGVKLSESTLKRLDANVVAATELLSFRDKLVAAKMAFAGHRILVSTYGISLGLQAYAVLEWMLMLCAVAVVAPKRILTAEHHDRWAVLADFYCTTAEKAGEPCRLELAQHGKEYESTYKEIEQITAQGNLPYRLRNVFRIHVYSPEQLEIFKKNILSQESNRDDVPLVEYFAPKITLTECAGSEPKVLFVGHPICEQFQIDLYQLLFSKTKVKCFYKPHPAAPASGRAKFAGWQLISDETFFPRVDLIISYPSTLIEEYKMMGVPSSVHSLRETEERLHDFAENTRAYLQRIVKEGVNEDERAH